MAVAFGTATSAVSAATSWSVTKPASLVAGETVVAFIVSDGTNAPTLTGGDPWLTLASAGSSGGVAYRLAWKIAGASEPASYTAGQSSTSTGHASIIRVTRIGSVAPIFAVNATGQSSTSISTPTLTPGGLADLLIRFVGGNPGGNTVTWTSPASHTERTDQQSGTQTTGSAATLVLASGAAVGTANFTATASVSFAIGITVAVSDAAPQTVTPSAIASSEAFGTTQLNLSVTPSGIASGEAFGNLAISTPLPQSVTLSSIASGEAFGTARLGLYVGPTAIASSEAFGSARLSAVIGLTGIASAEAFGLTNAAIQQFITPVGIASGQAFGSTRLRIGYPRFIFARGIRSAERVSEPVVRLRHQRMLRNPSIQEAPAALNRPFNRFGIHRGITIIKRMDGSYYSARYPAQTELEEAEAFYLGGRFNPVSNEVADELIAAGYGAYLVLVEND